MFPELLKLRYYTTSRSIDLHEKFRNDAQVILFNNGVCGTRTHFHALNYSHSEHYFHLPPHYLRTNKNIATCLLMFLLTTAIEQSLSPCRHCLYKEVHW